MTRDKAACPHTLAARREQIRRAKEAKRREAEAARRRRRWKR